MSDRAIWSRRSKIPPLVIVLVSEATGSSLGEESERIELGGIGCDRNIAATNARICVNGQVNRTPKRHLRRKPKANPMQSSRLRLTICEPYRVGLITGARVSTSRVTVETLENGMIVWNGKPTEILI